MPEFTQEQLSVLDQSAGPKGLVEFLEIYHPKWPIVLRYVINGSRPITVKHEDGQSFQYEYAPINITRSSSDGTLDQQITFTLGDLGEVVPKLIDLFIYDEDVVLPTISHRMYFIGQYDAPLTVVSDLELDSITRDWQGMRCEAKAPGLNNNGNGEIYSASKYPSLIGFY